MNTSLQIYPYLCTMGAGRPFNSKTPAWRSKPAIKVGAYKLLCYLRGREATKSECSRNLNLSRNTVIKWWNSVDWNGEDFDIFEQTFYNQALDTESTLGDRGNSNGLTNGKALLMDCIRQELLKLDKQLGKLYDLDRVKAVGFFDSYWNDVLYINAKRKDTSVRWMSGKKHKVSR